MTIIHRNTVEFCPTLRQYHTRLPWLDPRHTGFGVRPSDKMIEAVSEPPCSNVKSPRREPGAFQSVRLIRLPELVIHASPHDVFLQVRCHVDIARVNCREIIGARAEVYIEIL